MLISNRSTPVMRTGFTAACSDRTAAHPAASATTSRRLKSDTDSILLDGILIQVQTQPRQIGQVNVAVLDTEHIRCAQEFQSRRPLFLGKIRASNNLLPFTITHRTARLNVPGERKRCGSVLD